MSQVIAANVSGNRDISFGGISKSLHLHRADNSAYADVPLRGIRLKEASLEFFSE